MLHFILAILTKVTLTDAVQLVYSAITAFVVIQSKKELTKKKTRGWSLMMVSHVLYCFLDLWILFLAPSILTAFSFIMVFVHFKYAYQGYKAWKLQVIDVI